MASLTGRRIAASRWELLARFDVWLFASALGLLAIGLLSLYSITVANPAGAYFRKQSEWALIGIIPFAALLLIDPRVWKRYAAWLYAVNLSLLTMVLVKGRAGGGAQRWIQIGRFDFQPSELAKLLVVLTLSAFLVSRLDRIRSFSSFALSLLHVAVPMLLIYRQPHLGATLVILVAWLGVCLAAGVRTRYLVATVLIGLVGLGVALKYAPGKLFHGYQIERARAMLNPKAQGNAYQPLRAQIAFGVGGVTGAGFLKGEQKAARFIPEQQNDFIFTVIGEEGGLLGCTLVLVLFGVFFYRIWLISVQAEDPFYRMVAAGIFATLGFHAVVNLGMNLQLLPVVGLWLPFMSYGGTAMWLCMSCVALLLNMRSRQRPVL